MTTGESRDTVTRARRLLDFEAAHPKHSGWKEERIRADLGLAPARYYQLLHRAAASIEGQAHDAMTAHRLLRRSRARR